MKTISSQHSITVNILDRVYQVKCPIDMVQSLQEAALYVDQQMREVRDSGKVIGLERIAVISALNLAHELLYLSQHENKYIELMSSRIREMQEKVEEALTQQREIDV
jgi:cell division protein ZapA